MAQRPMETDVLPVVRDTREEGVNVVHRLNRSNKTSHVSISKKHRKHLTQSTFLHENKTKSLFAK